MSQGFPGVGANQAACNHKVLGHLSERDSHLLKYSDAMAAPLEK